LRASIALTALAILVYASRVSGLSVVHSLKRAYEIDESTTLVFERVDLLDLAMLAEVLLNLVDGKVFKVIDLEDSCCQTSPGCKFTIVSTHVTDIDVSGPASIDYSSDSRRTGPTRLSPADFQPPVPDGDSLLRSGLVQSQGRFR
jgi:hypothetical protein